MMIDRVSMLFMDGCDRGALCPKTLLIGLDMSKNDLEICFFIFKQYHKRGSAVVLNISRAVIQP